MLGVSKKMNRVEVTEFKSPSFFVFLLVIAFLTETHLERFLGTIFLKHIDNMAPNKSSIFVSVTVLII